MENYVVAMATFACLYALLALGLNLVWGMAGMINLGLVGFFGVGAYTSALGSLKLGISPWVTIWAGTGAAALFGVLTGYLCLRLRGSYLSLATLAFPLIALGILFAFPDFSGGELGVSGLRRLLPTPTGNYYMAVVSMLVVVFGLWVFADSKFGIASDARFDMQGFRNVLALRAEVEGTWGGKAPPAERYVDLSFYQNALKRVGR